MMPEHLKQLINDLAEAMLTSVKLAEEATGTLERVQLFPKNGFPDHKGYAEASAIAATTFQHILPLKAPDARNSNLCKELLDSLANPDSKDIFYNGSFVVVDSLGRPKQLNLDSSLYDELNHLHNAHSSLKDSIRSLNVTMSGITRAYHQHNLHSAMLERIVHANGEKGFFDKSNVDNSLLPDAVKLAAPPAASKFNTFYTDTMAFLKYIEEDEGLINEGFRSVSTGNDLEVEGRFRSKDSLFVNDGGDFGRAFVSDEIKVNMSAGMAKVTVVESQNHAKLQDTYALRLIKKLPEQDLQNIQSIAYKHYIATGTKITPMKAMSFASNDIASSISQGIPAVGAWSKQQIEKAIGEFASSDIFKSYKKQVEYDRKKEAASGEKIEMQNP